MGSPERVQLHLALSFKHQPADHPRIRALLDRGFRIVQLQRVTDDEVAVTLARDSQSDPSPGQPT